MSYFHACKPADEGGQQDRIRLGKQGIRLLQRPLHWRLRTIILSSARRALAFHGETLAGRAPVTSDGRSARQAARKRSMSMDE